MSRIGTRRALLASLTVTPWYRAGGAPQPLAAYLPLGAASLAASYVNLANPGTYNAAPGVAPTFDAATGWIGDGTKYLNTGITPTTEFTIICRISNVAQATVSAMGAYGGAALAILPDVGSTVRYWVGGNYVTRDVAPDLRAGVLATNRYQGYRNGVADGDPINGSSASSTDTIWLLGTNSAGGLAWGLIGNMQAAAIYNTSVNHAVWVPAVMAAMAAL